MDENLTLAVLVLRLVIFLGLIYGAYWVGRLVADRRMRAMLPHHSHRPTEGCERCRLDSILNL